MREKIKSMVHVLRNIRLFVAHLTEETRSGLRQQAVGRLRSASFDRQAIHDLASLILGGVNPAVNAYGTVGVIVPSCDRPHRLERALSSLAFQTRQPDRVVVVNDGRQRIDEIVTRFSGRLKIDLLATKNPYSGSSVARNIGLDRLDELDTSLIAFLDDDNLMWPRWLEQASAIFAADSMLDIVYGAQLRGDPRSTTDKNWFLVPFDLAQLQNGNFIDMNQIMQRSSKIRFNPCLLRYVDWDYVLRLIGNSPDRIVPVDAISSVYSTSSSDRISVDHWPPASMEMFTYWRRGETVPVANEHRTCSCCGYIGEFLPGLGSKRINAGCPKCGSLEYHRFLCLVAPLLRQFWIPATRPQANTTMIEITPSPATLPLRKMFGVATTIDADLRQMAEALIWWRLSPTCRCLPPPLMLPSPCMC